MKKIITIILIPLVIAFLGNNYVFKYGELGNDEKDLKGNIYKIDREIEIVPVEFISSNHNGLVRLTGVLLIIFPFLILLRREYIEAKADKLEPDGLVPEAKKIYDKEVRKITSALLKLFWIVFILITLFIIITSWLFDFEVSLYSLLVYERFMNFIISLV
jgi:hypothetical protein